MACQLCQRTTLTGAPCRAAHRTARRTVEFGFSVPPDLAARSGSPVAGRLAARGAGCGSSGASEYSNFWLCMCQRFRAAALPRARLRPETRDRRASGLPCACRWVLARDPTQWVRIPKGLRPVPKLPAHQRCIAHCPASRRAEGRDAGRSPAGSMIAAAGAGWGAGGVAASVARAPSPCPDSLWPVASGQRPTGASRKTRTRP